jgi:hypothetical protein
MLVLADRQVTKTISSTRLTRRTVYLTLVDLSLGLVSKGPGSACAAIRFVSSLLLLLLLQGDRQALASRPLISESRESCQAARW